jgi:hypothetical protein
VVERSAHNRLVVGSIPTGPRTDHFSTEDFNLYEMLEVLWGTDGRRKIRLRRKTNTELFHLYEDQLALQHRSQKALKEAKRLLGHFQKFLGEFPPAPELAASFLAQFTERKPTILYRYHSIVKTFMQWYGEPLNTKIKVPQTLPDYLEQNVIDKL